MTTRRVAGATIIILLVLILGFTLSVPRIQDVAEESETLRTEESVTVPTLTLERSYRRGTHTLTGTLLVDTYCTMVTTEAVVTPEDVSPSVITLKLATEEVAGVCLMLAEERSFSVSIEAPEDSMVEVFVNGESVPLPKSE